MKSNQVITHIRQHPGRMKNQEPNIDVETGIHYGCTHQNSLSSDALYDLQNNGRDLSHDSAVEQVKSELKSALSDYFFSSKLDAVVEQAWQAIEDDFNDAYEYDNRQWLYEKDGYIIRSCGDCDVFVIKSPFFTYCRPCSPCVPNAGDLDSPNELGIKTYCLHEDFFEDGKPPYEVYSCVTDSAIKKS